MPCILSINETSGFLEGMMSFCQLSASSDMSLQQLSRTRCCLSSSSGDIAGERQDHPGAIGKAAGLLAMAVLGSVQCLKGPDFHSDDGFLPYLTKGKDLQKVSFCIHLGLY